MAGVAYVNGSIGAIEDARVSIEDRGLQFGQSVYEVVHATNGSYFRLGQHMARLERSLRGAEIPLPMTLEQLSETATRILGASGEREGALYIQITAGVAPRQHVITTRIPPTVIMTFRPHAGTDHVGTAEGVRVVTYPDIRWARRDIKATTLLPNVLARQEATRQGAYEALLCEADGVITECSAASFFAVLDGRLRTHPCDGRILPGVTRAAVLDLSRALSLEYDEVAIRVDDLPRVTEAFITGTILGIAPVCQIDQTWQRTPGQITRRLQGAYRGLVERETNAVASSRG